MVECSGWVTVVVGGLQQVLWVVTAATAGQQCQ